MGVVQLHLRAATYGLKLWQIQSGTDCFNLLGLDVIGNFINKANSLYRPFHIGALGFLGCYALKCKKI